MQASSQLDRLGQQRPRPARTPGVDFVPAVAGIGTRVTRDRYQCRGLSDAGGPRQRTWLNAGYAGQRGRAAAVPATGRAARCRNRQPRARMAWLSPVMSSTGLWNGSRMSRSPSRASMRNRTPYRSGTEGADLSRRSGAGSLDTSRATTSSWAVADCQSRLIRFHKTDQVDRVRHDGWVRRQWRRSPPQFDLQPLHGIPGLRRASARPGPRGLDMAEASSVSVAIRSRVSTSSAGGIWSGGSRGSTPANGSRTGGGAVSQLQQRLRTRTPRHDRNRHGGPSYNKWCMGTGTRILRSTAARRPRPARQALTNSLGSSRRGAE